MWENQENQNPAEAEVIKPTYEELETALAGANVELAFQKQMRATDRTRLIDFEYKIEKAEEWIDEEADSLTPRQVEELCDILGIDNEITKTITVDAQFTIEITAPRGFDFDSIDEDSFEVSIEKTGWGSDWGIHHVSSTDITDVSVD